MAEVADRIIRGFQQVPGGVGHDFALSGEHNQVLKVGAGVDEVADGQVLDRGADCMDPAGVLVPEYDRQRLV